MIKLSADETRLFLAAKGFAIKGVSNRFALGSLDYIQDVVNARCGSEKNVDIFRPYMELAKKMLSSEEFAIVLANLYRRFENPHIAEPAINRDTVVLSLLIAIALKNVREFELDREWVKGVKQKSN